MKLRIAASALAGLMLAAFAAPSAEASHRHDRSCSHRSGYSDRGRDHRDRDYRSSDRYDRRYRGSRHRYGYRYAPPPVAYYYRSPAPGYYYDSPGYAYRSTRGHHHGRRWCTRPHVSLHIDW